MRIGETFKDGRYTVLHKLGWGHFSTVWMVSDAVSGTQAALKVVKSASHYTDAARDEVQLLAKAKEKDPADERHCCRLLDSFDHVGPHGRHVCMVFEVLGDNLLALIRAYNHRGIPVDVVRHLTRQVLIALDFLHTSCSIIHTDLKPENVMLKEPLKPRQPLSKMPVAPGQAGRAKAVGKIAAALAEGKQLTKNQKKKLKKKLAKQAEGAHAVSPEESETLMSLDGEDEGEGREDEGASHPPSDPARAAAIEQNSGAAEAAAERDAGNGRVNGGASEALASGELTLEERLLGMPCKVVDFGNACWTYKHFTEDIQTRQYRAPEVRNSCIRAL